MTIGKRSNFGFNVKRYGPTEGKAYLCFTFWYPVRWNKELGYRYSSIRWL